MRRAIASLLTGRYVAAHGADRGNPLPREVPVVAELLARAGYETAGISGNPYISEAYGFERGFRHFRSEIGVDVVPEPTMKPPGTPATCAMMWAKPANTSRKM